MNKAGPFTCFFLKIKVRRVIANPCTPVRFRYSPPNLFDELRDLRRAAAVASKHLSKNSIFCSVLVLDQQGVLASNRNLATPRPVRSRSSPRHRKFDDLRLDPRVSLRLDFLVSVHQQSSEPQVAGIARQPG